MEFMIIVWGLLSYILIRATFYVLGIGEPKNLTRSIEGYADADYAKDPNNCRSMTGYVFKVLGSAVSWKAQLQSVVALSTTEAEYIALGEAVKEALWLKGIVAELGISVGSVVVMCDNQGAVLLIKYAKINDRTKHIKVKCHFIRDVISANEVKVEQIGTEDNLVDMFTKVLPGSKFDFCVSGLGIA